LGNVRAHVFVSGRVQGVFFRQKTRQLAIGLNVTGWVRNLDDGRVEGVFEGEEEAVVAVVDFCRKGPKGAKVDQVKLNWEDFTGEFHNFAIGY
jgi:acylphosphatase